MTPPQYTCLIIDLMHPTIEPMLQEIGITPDYRPDITPAEIKQILPQYDGLLVRSKIKISADLIASANKLMFIARAGAGVDNIDEAALKQKGVALLNAPEGNADAVGEFTVGLLLTMFRNIVKANNEVRTFDWKREENRGEEIMGKTIGLIGYGNMGRAFARRLTGFGCEVLAYDTNPGLQTDGNAILVPLPEVFEQADVVSFHIPFNPENRRLGDEKFFSKFRKNIWVINTSRGEVLDQNALVQLLKTGKIKGAALDVLENEKLAMLSAEQKENFNYLTQANQVILTPHIGGWSHQSYRKINEVLTRKIKDLLSSLPN